MSKSDGKRREWVKTAAIVFLSVLLVLTFFSNTIMNYSLPEVATQYVENGTITAKVRGNGVVESNDPYSVKLKNSTQANATGVYKVESVEVKVGEKVEKGTVLCRLAAQESTDLKKAKEALNDLLLKYEKEIIQGNVSESALNHAQNGAVSSMGTYQKRLLDKENEIKALEDEVKDAEDTLAAWQRQLGVQVDTTDERKALDKAQAAYDDVKKIVDAADSTIEDWEKKIAEYQAIIDSFGLVTVSGGDSIVTPEEIDMASQNIEILKQKIAAKKTAPEVVAAKANLVELKEALDKAQKEYDNKASDNVNTSNENIQKWTKEVENRKKKVTEAEEEKRKIQNDIISELDWNQEISKQKEEIEKLQQEIVENEVKAPISGTITEIYVKSGTDTPNDGLLFTMQQEGKGFTMQLSVTNEQAKRLSVGDKADLVNAWRYDDVTVTLSQIKPDPSNPSKNKQLTFDVTGNVMAGQSLNISVGQKSANFDYVVPNSALHEDNNGKFILIIETRSTPLSNRYIATRVDVEVIASDDTRSAISGALMGYEHVITTSTAPVEAGKQVRLANN